jgi:hypothetical protein
MAAAALSCYTLAVMKPGMQRELLIAFRLLFEEFVLDDETPKVPATAPAGEPPPSQGQAGPPDKAE